MFLVVAAILLVGFVANVTIGSFQGQAPLGDVAEAILLFVASMAFVSGILSLEAKTKSNPDQDPDA